MKEIVRRFQRRSEDHVKYYVRYKEKVTKKQEEDNESFFDPLKQESSLHEAAEPNVIQGKQDVHLVIDQNFATKIRYFEIDLRKLETLPGQGQPPIILKMSEVSSILKK